MKVISLSPLVVDKKGVGQGRVARWSELEPFIRAQNGLFVLPEQTFDYEELSLERFKEASRESSRTFISTQQGTNTVYRVFNGIALPTENLTSSIFNVSPYPYLPKWAIIRVCAGYANPTFGPLGRVADFLILPSAMPYNAEHHRKILDVHGKNLSPDALVVASDYIQTEILKRCGDSLRKIGGWDTVELNDGFVHYAFHELQY